MYTHLVRIACASAFALAILGAAADHASAAPVVAEYDTFGACSICDFGGTGIPNGAVAMDQSQSLGTSIFMALTAHQRYSNPALTNNGAGTFYATTGGDTANGNPDYAKWNFGFTVSKSGGASSLTYFELLYDFDPGVGTDESQMGRVTLPISAENSWNLGMDFLAQIFPLIISPPPGSFNPNATGEYAFALLAKNVLTHQVIDRVSILVNTAEEQMTPVPEPTSMMLLGAGLCGLAGAARRRHRERSGRTA